MRAALSAFTLAALSYSSIPATAEMNEWHPELIAKYESDGGQNVPNFRFDGPAGIHSAGGVCQMLTSTWRRIAPTIDIDIEKFPVAGSAPEFTQWQACWKLWSVEGYRPWTCCNAKLRKIVGGSSAVLVNRRSTKNGESVPEEKPPSFMDRFSASSAVYSATQISLR